MIYNNPIADPHWYEGVLKKVAEIMPKIPEDGIHDSVAIGRYKK